MGFSMLTPSDWIALFSTIVTLLTSLVAIFISFFALKQSNNIILEANTPKIMVYGDSVSSGAFQIYLIIHNYGGSPTRITSITHSSGLHELDLQFIHNLIGSTIIPGQKIIHSLITDEDEVPEKIVVGVTYDNPSGGSKTESFEINLNRLKNTFYVKSESSIRTKDEIAKSVYTLNNTIRQLSHNSEKQNL